MLHARPLLALALLAALAGGGVVQPVHRALHAVEAAAERAEHVAGHHAGHDRGTPHAEAPCPPSPSEPDCAVCATPTANEPAVAEATPHATEAPERLSAQARATRLATASAGARGPPQT